MDNQETRGLIGSRIRKARENMGWSQTELAAKIGRESSSVSQYESGDRSVRIPDLPRLAEVLKVSVAYFFGEDELIGAIATSAQQLSKPNRRLLLSQVEHLLEVQNAEPTQIHQQNRRMKALIVAISHTEDMKSIKQLLSSYENETTTEDKSPKTIKATFTIYSLFDENKSFNGYHFGETWNGWACPYFTKSVAEEVLHACEPGGTRWHYAQEFDSYVVFDEDAPADYNGDIYQVSQIRDEQNQEIKVYPIGAFSWVWEIVENSSKTIT